MSMSLCAPAQPISCSRWLCCTRTFCLSHRPLPGSSLSAAPTLFHSSQLVLSHTISLLEEISPDFWSWWFLELVVPFKENSCGEKPALSPAILGSTWNNVEGKGHVSMLI